MHYRTNDENQQLTPAHDSADKTNLDTPLLIRFWTSITIPIVKKFNILKDKPNHSHDQTPTIRAVSSSPSGVSCFPA